MPNQYLDKAVPFLFLDPIGYNQYIDFECRLFLMLAYIYFVGEGDSQLNPSIYELHKKLRVDSGFVTRSIKKLSGDKGRIEYIKINKEGRCFYIHDLSSTLEKLRDEKLLDCCPTTLNWYQRKIIKSLLPETKFDLGGKTVHKKWRIHPELTIRDRAVLILMICLMNDKLEVTGYSHAELAELTELGRRQIVSHLHKFERLGILKTIIPGMSRGTFMDKSIYMLNPFYKPWFQTLRAQNATFISDGLYLAVNKEQQQNKALTNADEAETNQEALIFYPPNLNYKSHLKNEIKRLLEGTYSRKSYSQPPQLMLRGVLNNIPYYEDLVTVITNAIGLSISKVPHGMFAIACALSVPLLKLIIDSKDSYADRLLQLGIFQLQTTEITGSVANLKIELVELIENSTFPTTCVYNPKDQADQINLKKLSDKKSLLEIIKKSLNRTEDNDEQDEQIIAEFYQVLNAVIIGLAYEAVKSSRNRVNVEKKSISKSDFPIKNCEKDNHIHLIGLLPFSTTSWPGETWFHFAYSEEPHNPSFKVKPLNLRKGNTKEKDAEAKDAEKSNTATEETLEIECGSIRDIVKHIMPENSDNKTKKERADRMKSLMFLQVIKPSSQKNLAE